MSEQMSQMINKDNLRVLCTESPPLHFHITTQRFKLRFKFLFESINKNIFFSQFKTEIVMTECWKWL